MHLPIESVFDGTWSSGEWPAELVVADVLLETHWSWQQYIATPAWIQRAVWDTIQARRKKEADDRERHEREAETARRTGGGR